MKMDYVKNAIKEYGLDVLFIQEAEIKDSYQEDLYSVQGYATELCATTAGSKVRMVCYIKDSLKYRRKTEKESNNIMMLQIEETCQVQQVIGVYRAFKIEEGMSLHN